MNSSVPNPTQQATLESQGLLVFGGKARSLSISSHWTADEVFDWLQETLPKPFEWLNTNVSSPIPRFRLLIRKGWKFSLCSSKAPTGYDLNQYKGANGRQRTRGQVWIGRSYYIGLVNGLKMEQCVLLRYQSRYTPTTGGHCLLIHRSTNRF